MQTLPSSSGGRPNPPTAALEVLTHEEIAELSMALRGRRRELERIIHALNFDGRRQLVTVNGLIERVDRLVRGKKVA
jgi:hypothetical protein